MRMPGIIRDERRTTKLYLYEVISKYRIFFAGTVSEM